MQKQEKILNYTVKKQIRRGGYGTDYLVQDSKGVKYAAKKISTQNEDQMDQILNNQCMNINLRHENLLKTIISTYVRKENCVVIIQEYCEGGDLSKYIGNLNQNQYITLFKQILNGLSYLHIQKNTVHRNIKPESILMKDGVPKLGNLKFAREREEGGVAMCGGTFAYLAPQVFETQMHDKPADIWALGLTFLQIVLGKRMAQILEKSTPPGQIEKFPSHQLLKKIPGEIVQSLIKRMLERDPSQRITSQQIQNDKVWKQIFVKFEVLDYTAIRFIGQGGYGKVYQAENKKKEKYAVKKIFPQNQKKIDQILKNQGSSALRLQHKNILKTKDMTFIQKQKCVAIITEYCQEGDLTNIIGKIKENQIINLLKQIVDGMIYLHIEKNMVHRDIKPENIFIKNGVPKIADFGLITANKDKGVPTPIGTQAYMSPQVLDTQLFGKPDDIWALGITFLEIFFGKRMKNILGTNKLPGQIQTFPSKQLLKKIPDQNVRGLIQGMLMRDQLQRITIQQIKDKLMEYEEKANQMTQLQNQLKNVNLNKKMQCTITTSYQPDNMGLINNEKELVSILNECDEFPNVKQINLSNKQITNQGLTHLSKVINLQTINLENNQISDAGLANLSTLINLQTIWLKKNQIISGGLIHLSKLSNLQKLGLSSNKISNEGLIHLANLSNLRQIGLSGNKISNEGLAHLSKLKNLQKIWLSGNQITDGGLTHLINITNLQEIYLSNNQISDEGLISFAQQSNKLVNLKVLYLRGNKISGQTVEKIKQSLNIKFNIYS